jgi:3D (Asp-Asp-Asp) domain-containing protein
MPARAFFVGKGLLNMKKFITLAVIVASSAYYACLPFVVARADVLSFGTTTASDATTGTSAGTTVPVVPVTVTATTTVVSVLYQRITAYASVPDETDSTPFITADGSHVADGIAASNILPFGTRIEIPALFGDKIFTIHDRMSTRIKNTIDLWMPTVQQAIIFGAQHASILVLGSPLGGSETNQLAVKQ